MKYLTLFILFISTEYISAQQPVINSFSPLNAPAGATVTINGTNFNTVASANIVYFGGVKAAVNAASANSLTVTVPFGAGYQPISVTTNNLTAYSVKPFILTFPGGNSFVASSFAPRVSFTSSSDLSYGHPSNVTICDIDGDGKADLIDVQGSTFKLSVLRNTSVSGTLSFAPPIEFNTGSSPFCVVTGDLDGDGKMDLVVPNYGGANVSVFRNTSTTGSVSFASAVNFTTGTNPAHAAVIDLDADGRPEIITVNKGSNTVSIFKNTSSGGTITFAPKLDLPVGAGPLKLAVSDIDGDNKTDIVTLNNTANTISVLRNTYAGSISFASKIDLLSNTHCTSISLADVDSDGLPDIIYTSTDDAFFDLKMNTSSPGTISFLSTQNLPAGPPQQAVAVTDLDGDGKVDLIGAAGNSFRTLSLMKNLSTAVGSFPTGNITSLPTGSVATDIAVGDLDNDGKPDIAFSNDVFSRISVFRNKANVPAIDYFTPAFANGGGTVTVKGYNFTGATAVSLGGSPATSFNVTNSNTISAVVSGSATAGNVTVTGPYGTGSLGGFSINAPPSISSFTPVLGASGITVTINGNNFNATPSQNIVFFGAVKATVTAATATSLSVIIPAGASYQYVSVTDLTTNLTAFSQMPFTVTFPTNNVLSFANGVDIPSGLVSEYFDAGDIDGDGKTDFAVTNDLTGSGNYAVSIFRNTSSLANITMAGPVNFSFAQQYVKPYGVTIGDLDGDGKSDLVIPFDADSVWVMKSTSTPGNIAFAAKLAFPISIGRANKAFLADIDGDGRPDLVVSYETSTTQRIISVLRNTSVPGTIAFAPAIDYITDDYPQALRVADIDGDGKTDIVVANEYANSVSIFRNTSSPGFISFATKIDLPGVGDDWDIALGDLDGDGKPDIITTSDYLSSYSVSIFRNTSTQGSISFASRQNFATGRSPRMVSLSDFDGDGKVDVYTSEFVDDTVHVLRNLSTPGNINLSPHITIKVSPYSLFAINGVDIDGDSKPELISLHSGGSNLIHIRRNLTSLQTGLATLSNGEFIRIAPNPVSNELRMSYKLNGQNKLSFRIIDNNGRVVFSKTGYRSNEVIYLPNLSAGVYTIECIGNYGRQFAYQIIKQ